MSFDDSDILCQALGTTWWLELPDTLPPSERVTIKSDVIACINQFEADYSRFTPTSLISQINDSRELHDPDQALIDLLEYGQSLFTHTDGVFNMLIGGHLVQRGYDSNYSFTPQEEPITMPDPTTDLQIEPDHITLTEGTIDIGGFGKGYLIDIIVHKLNSEYELPHFLINGGGDMYAKTVAGKPLTIYLAHPHNPHLALASTDLENEAFAASSPHIRSWTYRGISYNHLVRTTTNPVTSPSDSVFIKASTAAMADALATTLLLLDPEPVQAFCRTRNIAAAFYFTDDARLVSTSSFTPLKTY